MSALRAVQLTLKIYHWAMLLEGVRDRVRNTKRAITKRAASHAKARAKTRRAQRRKTTSLFGHKRRPTFKLFGQAVRA